MSSSLKSDHRIGVEEKTNASVSGTGLSLVLSLQILGFTLSQVQESAFGLYLSSVLINKLLIN